MIMGEALDEDNTKMFKIEFASDGEWEWVNRVKQVDAYINMRSALD